MEKPPLGVIPFWLWSEMVEHWPPSPTEAKNRKSDLLGAYGRYVRAGLDPNPEWMVEWRYLHLIYLHEN